MEIPITGVATPPKASLHPDDDAIDCYGDEESLLVLSGHESARAVDEATDPTKKTGRKRVAEAQSRGEPERKGGANKAPFIRRVLVVDDEEPCRLLIKEICRRIGISCETAADAQEALDKLRGNAFDLVVSDIRMKGKDGLALMREARQEFPQLDFIIMTGYTPDFSYSDIIAAGATDFIAKPFDIGEIEAKLRRISREKLVLRQLQKALLETIDVLGSALEMRDPYTAGHQRRVARLAWAIGQEMGLGKATLTAIRMAGLVHDIGKIAVPSQILSKPSQLKETEMSLIREHSEAGYEILRKVHFPWPIARIVRQHHERLDGSGYPHNLVGDEIMLEARILAVADVVEAMSSHRPYRAALGTAKALKEIENNKDRLYDERAVRVCLKLFREKDYQFE